MLEDAISIEGAKRAISDTSGMIPYQTFEGADIFGNHVIRVVMSMDPNRTALVKSMLSNQGAIQPNMYKISKKSLRDRLLLDKETLFHQFGTRLFYDEKGYPVLVSFGQSSIENETSRAAQAAKLKVAI